VTSRSLQGNAICARTYETGGRNPQRLIDLHMPRSRASRRYSIEIKDAEGAVVFCAVVCWDDKDKRGALAQIERIVRLPEPNVYTGRALVPEPTNSEMQRRSRAVRLDRDV
jgi:hypothetical protein